jgi:CDGSH-type Zn-finger protein
MDEVVIKARHNGPYKVTGPVKVIDADGTEYDLSDKGEAVALCRCGGSTTKPFCDGTHSKIGFQAAERAVAQEASRRPAGSRSRGTSGERV